MAFTFLRSAVQAHEAVVKAAADKQKKAKKKIVKPDAPEKPLPVIDLNQQGRLCIADVCRLIRKSRTTLYTGIKAGRYPPADGYDANMPYWDTGTIKAYLEKKPKT